jgi:hypothetical protein
MAAYIKYQLTDVVNNIVSLTVVTEREDKSVRSTQTISLPVVAGCAHHAEMFLLTFMGLMRQQMHTLNLIEVIGPQKPTFEKRDVCNSAIEKLLEYTYEYIRNGGDETEISRLFDVADLMYRQIHEYYRSFD